jgi:hypothetical protein
MQPASPQLAEIWQRACRNCHIVRDSGTPLASDAAAWKPRLAQGMDLAMSGRPAVMEPEESHGAAAILAMRRALRIIWRTRRAIDVPALSRQGGRGGPPHFLDL